jgi:hypothetical protein
MEQTLEEDDESDWLHTDNTYQRVIITNGFVTSTPSRGQPGSAATLVANVVKLGASKPLVSTGMANNYFLTSILYPNYC